MNFFKVDTIFYNLSSLWQSFIDDKKYDLFVASYQTISLIILISSIYFLCGKWRNTILFLNLFGSLQFHHLSLCTLRQGLSSSLTVVLLILVFKREELLYFNHKSRSKLKDQPSTGKSLSSIQSLTTKKISSSQPQNTLFILNTSIVILTLLSINTHWLGIVIAMIIYTIRYLYKVRTGREKVILPVLVFLALLFPALSVVGYRLEVYLAEASSGYGEKISFTVVSDLALIALILSNKLKNLDISINSICYFALLIISSLIISLKIITLFGFGLALRPILGLTTLQLICLPPLLTKLNFLSRLSVLALISLPYVAFIFLNNTEKFISI